MMKDGCKKPKNQPVLNNEECIISYTGSVRVNNKKFFIFKKICRSKSKVCRSQGFFHTLVSAC